MHLFQRCTADGSLLSIYGHWAWRVFHITRDFHMRPPLISTSLLKMVDIGEGQYMYPQGKKLYPARYRQAFKDKL